MMDGEKYQDAQKIAGIYQMESIGLPNFLMASVFIVFVLLLIIATVVSGIAWYFKPVIVLFLSVVTLYFGLSTYKEISNPLELIEITLDGITFKRRLGTVKVLFSQIDSVSLSDPGGRLTVRCHGQKRTSYSIPSKFPANRQLLMLLKAAGVPATLYSDLPSGGAD